MHTIPFSLIEVTKGQNEFMRSSFLPKCQPKSLTDFCPGSLLEGKAEILQIFGQHFGRNDDLIMNLTDLYQLSNEIVLKS